MSRQSSLPGDEPVVQDVDGEGAVVVLARAASAVGAHHLDRLARDGDEDVDRALKRRVEAAAGRRAPDRVAVGADLRRGGRSR